MRVAVCGGGDVGGGVDGGEAETRAADGPCGGRRCFRVSWQAVGCADLLPLFSSLVLVLIEGKVGFDANIMYCTPLVACLLPFGIARLR